MLEKKEQLDITSIYMFACKEQLKLSSLFMFMHGHLTLNLFFFSIWGKYLDFN